MRSLLLVLLLVFLTAIQSAARGQTFETLVTDNQGRAPFAKLVQGNDGNFYGTTLEGGASSKGTIFKVTPDGALSTLVSFNGANGRNPIAALVEGSDGSFYGTTAFGGASDYGTVFKMTPEGALTTLVSFNFPKGHTPLAGLLQGTDGNFYGTTAFGGASNGTVFKMTPGGELTTLASFNASNGSTPQGVLVQGTDGEFYGTTSGGGTSGKGTVFKMTPSGELTTIVSLDSSSGGRPTAGLVVGSDGNFYGTTSEGGEKSFGTIFTVTPSGELTTLASLEFPNSNSSSSELVAASDGNFYGTIYGDGASNYGTIFRMTPSGMLSTLVTLSPVNGSYLRAGLVEGSDGNLYGTTSGDGHNSYGTVFKVTPAGELVTLFSFNRPNESYLGAGLVEGDDGNFYGTTPLEGLNSSGSVFRMTPAGELATVFSFNRIDGSKPVAGLLKGSDGNFYGTTTEGGEYFSGTVFKMTPAGVLSTLATFQYDDGNIPCAGLIEGSDGNFYGITEFGGTTGDGTIFRVTPSGELTTITSFNRSNGSRPRGSLVEGRDGNYYGTTSADGAGGFGTIFKMSPSGEVIRLVSFNRNNGSRPYDGLVEASDGNFYGTTTGGGTFDLGTAFRMTPAGELTTLVSFNSTNGSYPRGLALGNDGNFYGITFSGGANNYGTIFKMTPSGGLTTLYSFDGTTAVYPEAPPVFGGDGKLYGTARQIAIWRLWLASPPDVSNSRPAWITSTGAMLTGNVNANGGDTTVAFEYGLSPEYGSSIAVSSGTVTGRETTAVSAWLSGLAPHTTYYFRLIASNPEGVTSTTGGSFTTAVNSPPVARIDSFVPEANEVGVMPLAVLGNDSDADGDPLTITATTQGLYGTVAINGGTLTYIPGPNFLGRDSFSYTISDGFDTATAPVELQADELFTRVLLDQGSGVPGAGDDGSGIPHGALFKRFGVPSINSAGKLAFTASYATPGLGNELSVFGYEPQAMKSTLAASWGQTAPGTQGARFTAFKDPLLNEGGDVAFLATLSGGDTTRKNREGIWVRSFSEAGGGETELIARTGAQSPGVADGARWKRFVDVAFSSREHADSDSDGWSLAFTGFMSTGAGGVKVSTDMGLWIANPEGTVLALREGQKLFIGETEKQIRSFAALKALPNAVGQGSGLSGAGGVAVQVFFKDGSQALLRVSRSDAGADEEIETETLALPGDAIADAEETAAVFGLPTHSSSGAVTAWVGTLSGKGNPAAILQRNESDLFFLKRVASKGDAAPGIDSATFSSFRSVAVSDSGSAFFLGKVKGRGVSTSNDDGLWWKQVSSNEESSSFQLLAREGTQPPGTPEGAKWSSFTSLALSDGQYGPLFTARLAGARGKAGQGWGSSANDQGLWALDSQGELQLIVHEGQEVAFPGSDTPRTIRSFTVLSAVPGSPAQRRSFDDEGLIVYRAFFTDGSQAVVKVQVP